MPDDANGNFSLVSGYLAVTGQTIQPSQHNPVLEDIAPALTNRLSRSGVAPMTGPLKTVTGSASVPAISPNSNPAIGIYWTATGVAFAGTVAGTRYIGELIPYTRLTAPALTVLPYGQTLLRASYPELWAVAQTEIAAGNTFYNNGDGTTTFGIGDMRGRVPAGKDDMGGTSAARLSFSFGSNNVKLGAAAGLDYEYLTQGMLPAVAPTFSGNTDAVSVTSEQTGIPINTSNSNSTNVSGGSFASYPQLPGPTGNIATRITSAGTFQPRGTISALGSGLPHATAQPTMICNYLLYVGA